MNKVNIKLVKIKSRFVLTLYGQELVYDLPNFNKKMEWKNYSSAEGFLMSNEFYINGKIINKDNIVITEFKEQEDVAED